MKIGCLGSAHPRVFPAYIVLFTNCNHGVKIVVSLATP